MTNSKNTKRALLSSVISLLLCVAMLIGATFAWFTDSVTTGQNKIVAGNLDVNLKYTTNGTDWENVVSETNLFKPSEGEDATLWEPGHMEIAYLKVENLGSLALKYQLDMNAVDTVISTSVTEKVLKLSEHLKYTVIELTANDGSITLYTRDTAKEALKTATIKALNEAYTDNGVMYPAKANNAEYPAEKYLALIVYMPEDVGNDANHKTTEKAPEINLGINLVATQTPYERDSFDEQYDAKAMYPAVDENSLTKALATRNSIINLGDDIVATKDFAIKSIGVKPVVNLNEKAIRFTNNGTNQGFGFRAYNGTILTINGNGTITSNPDEGNATSDVDSKQYGGYSVTAESGGKVVINGGHYIANVTAVYANGGTVEINGGFFDYIRFPNSSFKGRYLLNLKDNNASSKIIVKGGTFVNFNPADNQAEGPGTDFVAEGYTVKNETQPGGDIWYTVVPE